MVLSAQRNSSEASGLTSHLSPIGAWALAFGSSVGWGAFVMPGTTFLPIAGPLGSAIGLAIGAVVMLLIGVNYHFLTEMYPGPGGAFAYTKKTFGYDHGFLCAWFLMLTYTAIIWANASALPLIARNLLNGLFQVGFRYQIAGFQIYAGEIILAIGAICIASLVCLKNKLSAGVQILLALMLAGGIAVCFCFVAVKEPVMNLSSNLTPGETALGTFNVIALAPWAYVGFESISHSSGEFRFSRKRFFPIVLVALVTAAAVYIMLVLMAAWVHPGIFSGWQDYISHLGGMHGMEALPTFFAAETAMGKTGLLLMGLAAVGGIFTGLIGNLVASSRLVCAMAEDRLLPGKLSKLNQNGAPRNAILVLMAVSMILPFFGRTAISWIVDVTTIGAAVAYAYTSACALKNAREQNRKTVVITGGLGLVASLLFLLYFLLPNMLSVSTLSAESYLILASWSILGFAVFHWLFRRDQERRMGHTSVVWIVLLSLILLTSMIWVRQSASNIIQDISVSLNQLEEDYDASDRETLEEGMRRIERTVKADSMVQMALIVASLTFMFRIYDIMRSREKQMEVDKILAEESSRAKTFFLSNMSHEIRTPMNAIIGLDNIALKDPELSPRTREQLEKIGSSAKHLLGLINDILDMSRIESGRMVLKSEEFQFHPFLDQINVMIHGQCQDKGLKYDCNIVGHTDEFYVGDDMKLKQVLINILGNSVKFTNAPGTVTFNVEQVNSYEGHRTLRFTMKDTGIGMDAAYIPKIFEAFSQEDGTTTNRYGGSGLGMAITKNIVEMMNGEIQVESTKGVGSTFTVTVTLKASSRSAHQENPTGLPGNLNALVVDDDEVACEHAKLVLNDIGIHAHICTSGKAAFDLLAKRWREGNPYDLLLTDYRMPEMNGVELTHSLRQFDNGQTAVLILTGYSFDDMHDDAFAEGADAVLNKPLFSDSLLREIQNILLRKAPQQSTQEERTEIENTSVDDRPLAGLRLLIAEDMEINAEILMDLLEMEEVSSEHAINGQEAVNLFSDHPAGYYDAILMDVRMPVMDGLTATRTIRALEREDASTIPIIAMTANAFDEDMQRSLQAGMNAHLSKPVEPERLYDTLRKFVHR